MRDKTNTQSFFVCNIKDENTPIQRRNRQSKSPMQIKSNVKSTFKEEIPARVQRELDAMREMFQAQIDQLKSQVKDQQEEIHELREKVAKSEEKSVHKEPSVSSSLLDYQASLDDASPTPINKWKDMTVSNAKPLMEEEFIPQP